MSPTVSVIIPVFNEPAAVLQESLGSVAAQTFTDFECIVVDESTSQSRAQDCAVICSRDPRFRYIHPSTRLGLAASLNLGIANSVGVFVARFDSDDICVADRLQLQVEFLASHPEIDVLGGGLEIIDEKGCSKAHRYYPSDHPSIARKFHFTTPIAHPTAMIRRKALELYGVYDPDFRFSEDLDLWLRMLKRGARFANLNRTLVRYRQGATHRKPKHWRSNLRARFRNFAADHLMYRITGIAAIAIWSILPRMIQTPIFRMILFRSKHFSSPQKHAAAGDPR